MTVTLLIVVCGTIFGAAAAVNMPALGGSSIQPSVFALAFLAARLAASRQLMSEKMNQALKDSLLFGLFAAYGVLSAFVFPRLFYHQVELPPTRIISTAIFAVAPLQPSSQNITQATYLLGTFFVILATAFIARTERRPRLVMMTLIYLSWAHIAFGILDVLFSMLGLPFMDIVRNANYSVVDQHFGAFRRIQGTFAETSAYSAYGFVLLIFMTELWLRDVEGRLTGVTSLALGVTLFMSTSSSAYLGLGVYGLILAARIVYLPTPTAQRKGLILACFGILAIAAILAICVAQPRIASEFGRMLTEMTVKKGESFSAIQRGFWTRKGWEAFTISNGLGVGVGSFRSSSLVSAVAGSMGVFGLATLGLFLARILPIQKLSSYQLDCDRTAAVGIAAAWAALVGLAPGMVSATSPDPGVMFAFMAGLAMAWAPRGRYAAAQAAGLSPSAQAAGRS